MWYVCMCRGLGRKNLYAGSTVASPMLFRICIPSPACCCELWEVDLACVNVGACVRASQRLPKVSLFIISIHRYEAVMFDISACLSFG